MIELKNVSKFYSSEGNMAVGIQNVSLSYDLGEFVAITGESGSGKSTLLSVISGLDSYEEGEMLINGQSTSDYTREDFDRYRNQMVGFVFQNYNLIDSYSVLENVMLPLLAKGMKPKDAKKDALSIIEKVGLKGRIRSKASKLSGGEKQRTVIARALASGAPIIACDEPTGNLDSQTSKEILGLLNNIRENRLVLIVTHDYDAVKPYCTRHTVLKDGHVADDRVIAQKGASSAPAVTIEKHSNSKNLLHVAWSNVIHTPKRTVLSLLMATVTSIAILAIIGGFIQTSDRLQDLYTEQSIAVFDNKAHNRLVTFPNGSETDTLDNILGEEEVFVDTGNLISDLSFLITNTSFNLTDEEFQAWNRLQNSLYNCYPNYQITDSMSLVIGRAPTSDKEFAFIFDESLNFTTAVSQIPGIVNNSHWSLIHQNRYSGEFPLTFLDSACVGIYTFPNLNGDIAIVPSPTFTQTLYDAYDDYCRNDGYAYYQMSQMSDRIDLFVDGKEQAFTNSFYDQYVYDNNDASTGNIISFNNVVIADSYYQTRTLQLKIYSQMVTIPSADIVYHDFNLEATYGSVPILFTVNYAKALMAESGSAQSIFLKNPENMDEIEEALLEKGFETYRSDVTVQSLNYTYIFGNLLGILLTLFSFVGYLVLGFVTYLVSRLVFMLIYQNKKKDYGIFETLGMSKANLRFINRTETAIVFLASYVIASVALLFIQNFPYNWSLISANPLLVVLSLAIIFVFAILIARRYEKKLFALTVNKVLKAGDFLD